MCIRDRTLGRWGWLSSARGKRKGREREGMEEMGALGRSIEKLGLLKLDFLKESGVRVE